MPGSGYAPRGGPVTALPPAAQRPARRGVSGQMVGPAARGQFTSLAALTLTYDAVLSRVRVAVSGLHPLAVTVVVDRCTASGRWITVRSADGAPVSAAAARVDDYEFPADVPTTYRVRSYSATGVLLDLATDVLTAVLGDVWLKSITRPFLNVPLTACDLASEVVRPFRGGLFDIVGRTAPVAVTDIRGSRRFSLQVLTDTTSQRDRVDLALASGDPMYLHAPAAFPEPSMYCAIGDVGKQRARQSQRCVYLLPLIEVAAPGADVVGSTSTWQTVINTYGTWAEVLTAHATWAELLELIGDPTEVIIP